MSCATMGPSAPNTLVAGFRNPRGKIVFPRLPGGMIQDGIVRNRVLDLVPKFCCLLSLANMLGRVPQKQNEHLIVDEDFVGRDQLGNCSGSRLNWRHRNESFRSYLDDGFGGYQVGRESSGCQ